MGSLVDPFNVAFISVGEEMHVEGPIKFLPVNYKVLLVRVNVLERRQPHKVAGHPTNELHDLIMAFVEFASVRCYVLEENELDRSEGTT
jgi:hypothetical protein